MIIEFADVMLLKKDEILCIILLGAPHILKIMLLIYDIHAINAIND